MSRHFDLVAIGGGSGGLAVSKRAAGHGAKAAVVESGRLGGTCVNVGCVPKKVMWNAATIAHALHDAEDYGFSVSVGGHDWGELKSRRDVYVERLNHIHRKNLERAGVEFIPGRARLTGPRSLQVGEQEITADHIVVATGGFPVVPAIPGADWGITSDGFFELGDREVERTLTVNTVMTFAQTLKMMALSKELIETDDIATKREAYYVSKNWSEARFKEQPESDTVMEDVEAFFQVNREQLGFVPEEKGGDVAGRLVEKLLQEGHTVHAAVRDPENAKKLVDYLLSIEVEKKLADGGMGSVWLGEDTNLGRNVVVKVPHVRFLGEAGFRRVAKHDFISEQFFVVYGAD